MTAVDDIKVRLDIVEYVSRFVPLKKAGRVFKACCPWHNERTPSFVVDPVRQTCRCYGACNTGGDIFAFAMKQNGWDFPEALKELAALAGVELHQHTPQEAERQAAQARIYAALDAAGTFYRDALKAPASAAKAALEYAHDKRGLTPETLDRFGIGYAPGTYHALQQALNAQGYDDTLLFAAGLLSKNDDGRTFDRYRNRLMIPIRDSRGRVISFGARALAAGDEPKYLNGPETGVFNKGRVLFGLDLAAAAIRGAGAVVIVEGYMDVIALHQAGYSNVVAQMGTAITETQLGLVAPKLAKRVIMALDADAAGQNGARRSLDVAREALVRDDGARAGVDMRILAIPGAKDPDELVLADPAAWGTLVDQAVTAADFVIGWEASTLPLNASPVEREEVAKRVLPMLVLTASDLQRQANLQTLALRLRLPERAVMAMAAPNSPPRGKGGKPPAAAAPVVDTSALEKRVIGYLLQKPEVIYMLNRDLRNAGIHPVEADDFGTYPIQAALLLAALEQDDLDPLDYIARNAAEYSELIEELRHSAPVTTTFMTLLSDMQRLRLMRIVARIDGLAAVMADGGGDPAALNAIITEMARTQAMLNTPG